MDITRIETSVDTEATAFDTLARQHPDDATIVDLAKLTMTEATDFVRAHDLLTLIMLALSARSGALAQRIGPRRRARAQLGIIPPNPTPSARPVGFRDRVGRCASWFARAPGRSAERDRQRGEEAQRQSDCSDGGCS